MKKAYFYAFNVSNPGGTTRYIENFVAELREMGIYSTVINHLNLKNDFEQPSNYLIIEEREFDFASINPEDSILFICRESFFEKAREIKKLNPKLFIVGEIHAPIQMFKNTLELVEEIDLYKVNTKYSMNYIIENYECTNIINNYVSIYHIQENINIKKADVFYIDDKKNSGENNGEENNSDEYDMEEEVESTFDYQVNEEDVIIDEGRNLFIHTRFEDGQKNVQYAIKLVAAYNSINSEKITLYIDGYGPCETMYKTLSKFYNMEHYIHINTSNKPSKVVHLSTARSESFGYSITEGILSGRVLVYRGIYPEIDEIYNEMESVTFLEGNLDEDIDVIKSIWEKKECNIVEEINKLYKNTNIDKFAFNYISKIEAFRENNE